MKQGNIVGKSWINRKARSAEKGDSDAMNQLINTYVREVKRANQRARELDKRSMSTGALIKYRKGMDGNYLSQSRGLSTSEMKKNLARAEEFLKSQTSTVSGEKARRRKVFDSFSKPKYDENGNKIRDAWIKPVSGMSKRQQEAAMNRFFTNKHFEELKKYFGSGIIAEASEAVSKGIPIGRLSRLYNEYLKAEKADIDMVWDAWTKGQVHL